MSVQVRVDVRSQGTGSVAVTVALPPSTASALDDLRTGLPTADLRRAGWALTGPVRRPDGTTVLSAVHSFSALSQVPVLIGDVAGSGAISARPFRLHVSEGKGLLHDTFIATGTVDLRCSLSCFGDPALRATTGYPLGLPMSQLSELLGAHPGQEVKFSFWLSLPGGTVATNGRKEAGAEGWLAWPAQLGSATDVRETSRVTNAWFVRDAAVAVGAGAVVVLLTALALLGRRRRREAVTGRN